MASNRGKEFENKIQEALEKLDKTKLIYQRLYDVTMGYSGIHNPCDFIVYTYPYCYYIECKSTNENTLNFSAVSQYDDLLEASKRNGVWAGILVWYIKHQETYWVDIKLADMLRDTCLRKSLNIKELRELSTTNRRRCFKIDGENKRVYTEYNLESFFEHYTQFNDF